MNPKLRRRLQLIGLASALVGLAGSAFAAGASTVTLVAERRRGRQPPVARNPSHGAP